MAQPFLGGKAVDLALATTLLGTGGKGLCHGNRGVASVTQVWYLILLLTKLYITNGRSKALNGKWLWHFALVLFSEESFRRAVFIDAAAAAESLGDQ